MRAIVVRRYGAPEVFEVQQVPDPQPKPGEMLIRVKAIGINFADLLQRMGLYPGTPKPPFVPGLELAGVVEKIVPSTTKPASASDEPLKVGDAVAAITQFNGYAEWVAVPAQSVHRMPSGMTFEDGAAILVNYMTAYHAMFTMGNLQTGDRILIHNAAGGVGIAAVQLARAKGLITIGTAGSTKQEYLRKMGVNHPVDHTRGNIVDMVRKYAPDGVELAMDAIGGKSFRESFECLGPVGRLVVYGSSSLAGPDGKRNPLRLARTLLETPRFHPLKLMEKNAAVIGVNLGAVRSKGALLESELGEIFRLYAAGKIKPVIGKVFPLDQAAAAHHYIHERKNIGKVLLR
jgi:synaptic vesicle membrane protein VAT-1